VTVALLTDFGIRDHYVAAVKGVVLSRAPSARLIDITHEIRPHRVEDAAFVLAACYDDFPAGTVFLVVVDPGVGSARRAVVIEAGGYRFVGPDNGVFSFVLDLEGTAVIR
jgi:S-adenosyl-L-methionine hydrolase (adenosine-forming)